MKMKTYQSCHVVIHVNVSRIKVILLSLSHSHKSRSLAVMASWSHSLESQQVELSCSQSNKTANQNVRLPVIYMSQQSCCHVVIHIKVSMYRVFMLSFIWKSACFRVIMLSFTAQFGRSRVVILSSTTFIIPDVVIINYVIIIFRMSLP